MRRFRNFVLSAALLAGAGLAAHAADVKTDYDHHADFKQYHTYSWGKVTTSNPFYVDRIKDAVNRDLQSKGWQMVPSGGDVTIFAKGNVHNQQEMETFYNGLGGGWGGRWGWGGWGMGGRGFGETSTTTVNHPVANLVIDMFNGQSKEIVWRGMSDEDLSKSDEKNTKKLDSDIDKMLKNFPPKK